MPGKSHQLLGDEACIPPRLCDSKAKLLTANLVCFWKIGSIPAFSPIIGENPVVQSLPFKFTFEFRIVMIFERSSS